MSVSEVEELLQSGKLINRLDFVFGITPTVFFNTHTKNKDGIFISAKSPVLFPVYFGMSVPNYTAVSFQPTLKIFSSYNLVYEDMVLPAEIENRTGLTYSFLLNLPVVFKLNYKNKCSWSLSSGIAGLFRFAVLPDGVQTDESGYTGTVESDIKFMNSWFYENLRFLYLSAGFDWMFYYGKTKYGPEISIYFPISTFPSEIIPYSPVTPVPNSHPSIEGLFMPRDIMITAIDLKNCLALGTAQAGGLFIVTNFNHLDIAFHVDSVVGIHRVSWTEIIKPNVTVTTADESISTGIIKIDEKLVIILDFEKILSDINPDTGLKVEEVDLIEKNSRRAAMPILIAEDSVLLNKMIVESLKKAGYVQLVHTANGQEAYDQLMEYKEAGTIKQNVQCIITDIEMPLMDGHRLTKLVKTDEALKDIPVVIFSSLVNDEMRRKGESLGADAQLSKPEIGNLVRIIDGLLLN